MGPRNSLPGSTLRPYYKPATDSMEAKAKMRINGTNRNFRDKFTQIYGHLYSTLRQNIQVE